MDVAVGSAEWAMKAVCDHYCGEGSPCEMAADGSPAIGYRCPGCGEEGGITLRFRPLQVWCVNNVRRGCVASVGESLALVAEIEDLDIRNDRKAVQDRRREILSAAKDAGATAAVEVREVQEVRAEIEQLEARYGGRHRLQAAADRLACEEREAEEQRRRETHQEALRDAEARHERSVGRVIRAYAAITGREALILAGIWVGVLAAIFYGLGWLDGFAHHEPQGPAPGASQGFGTYEASEGEDDFWVTGVLREIVGGIVPAWLFAHALPAGLLAGAVAGGAWWLRESGRRRSLARFSKIGDVVGCARTSTGEYAGIYHFDREGRAVWLVGGE